MRPVRLRHPARPDRGLLRHRGPRGPARGRRYNVAPTNDVYAVLEDGSTRHLDAFHWGLVPHWAKDPKIGSKMINARAETVADEERVQAGLRASGAASSRPTGSTSGRRRPGEKAKQPFFIHRPDGEPYAFAGLWEVWRGPDRDQEPLRSCTIITTTPNEPMAAIHDRMPVILPPDGVGHLARPGQPRPRAARASSWCPPRRAHHHAPGVDRGEQRPQRRPAS